MNSLREMGFSERSVADALGAMRHPTIDQAVDWIAAHAAESDASASGSYSASASASASAAPGPAASRVTGVSADLPSRVEALLPADLNLQSSSALGTAAATLVVTPEARLFESTFGEDLLNDIVVPLLDTLEQQARLFTVAAVSDFVISMELDVLLLTVSDFFCHLVVQRPRSRRLPAVALTKTRLQTFVHRELVIGSLMQRIRRCDRSWRRPAHARTSAPPQAAATAAAEGADATPPRHVRSAARGRREPNKRTAGRGRGKRESAQAESGGDLSESQSDPPCRRLPQEYLALMHVLCVILDRDTGGLCKRVAIRHGLRDIVCDYVSWFVESFAVRRASSGDDLTQQLNSVLANTVARLRSRFKVNVAVSAAASPCDFLSTATSEPGAVGVAMQEEEVLLSLCLFVLSLLTDHSEFVANDVPQEVVASPEWQAVHAALGHSPDVCDSPAPQRSVPFRFAACATAGGAPEVNSGHTPRQARARARGRSRADASAPSAAPPPADSGESESQLGSDAEAHYSFCSASLFSWEQRCSLVQCCVQLLRLQAPQLTRALLSLLLLLSHLTRSHRLATVFFDSGGLEAMTHIRTYALATQETYTALVCEIMRHIFESPTVLQHLMESEIVTVLQSFRSSECFLKELLEVFSSMACRSPATFTSALANVCDIELASSSSAPIPAISEGNLEALGVSAFEKLVSVRLRAGAGATGAAVSSAVPTATGGLCGPRTAAGHRVAAGSGTSTSSATASRSASASAPACANGAGGEAAKKMDMGPSSAPHRLLSYLLSILYSDHGDPAVFAKGDGSVTTAPSAPLPSVLSSTEPAASAASGSTATTASALAPQAAAEAEGSAASAPCPSLLSGPVVVTFLTLIIKLYPSATQIILTCGSPSPPAFAAPSIAAEAEASAEVKSKRKDKKGKSRALDKEKAKAASKCKDEDVTQAAPTVKARLCTDAGDALSVPSAGPPRSVASYIIEELILRPVLAASVGWMCLLLALICYADARVCVVRVDGWME